LERTSNETNAIPVVLFTGGPTIATQVVRFIARLEDEPTIRLLAIVSQAPFQGPSGIVIELWKRRGALAAAILLGNVLRSLVASVYHPLAGRRRRRLLACLRKRIHFVDDLHAEDVLQLVRELRPALGLVYGGPIIRPELYSIPALGTLGIHHGKVPQYRGKKTTFWAIYNGEREVGVVIQRISSRLDAGDIVMQATVAVRNRLLPIVKKDLEDTGIDLYLRAIKAVASGGANYVPQPAGSHALYRDPTASDIIRFWGKYLARLILDRRAHE
jgi:hypothetical protein